MVKSKEEKEDEERQESKSDGLEIISIGSLYEGPWNKKYWSASRGKDRYPYPVGYRAVRAQNGSIYNMEIHEGPNGPLFMITSNGHSSSGQTPDIAWEKFQKTGCPHLKIWHGKRFSCKIDGVEFFGFKNPFVQRLLRELVANVKGAVEQTSTSHSFCSGSSSMEHASHRPDVCMYPDLLSYLPRQLIRKKRSPKCETIKSESANRTGIKRTITQIPTSDAMDPISIKVKQSNAEHGTLVALSTWKEENNYNSSPRELLHIKPISEDKKESSTNDISLKSVGYNNLREKVASEENTKSLKVARSSMELHRLQDTDLYQPMGTDDKSEDSNFPKDSLGFHNEDIFAPDTFDLVPVDSVPEEIGAFDLNTCSEKSDFDSIGQETAKLMMTVLLPQAVPLLKGSSRKKKRSMRPSNKRLSSDLKCLDDNTDTKHYLDVPSSVVLSIEKSNLEEEKMQMQHIDPGSIVLDSFEDDKCDNPITNSTVLYKNLVEAAEVNYEVTAVNVRKESSVCCVEISGSEDTSKSKGECSVEFSIGNLDAETGVAKAISATQFQNKVYHRRKVSKQVSSTQNYNGPLSETIVCRGSENASAIEKFSSRGAAISLETCRLVDEACNHGKKSHHLKLYQATVDCSASDTPNNLAPVSTLIQGMDSVPKTSPSLVEEYQIHCEAEVLKRKNCAEYNHSALSPKEGKTQSDNKTSNTKPILSNSDFKPHRNLELYNELEEVFQIVGCYFHHMPVSSLLLREQGDEIYICVSCGLLTDMIGTLIVYKVAVGDQKMGHPSFLGHTSVKLPFSKDKYGREVALQRCGLQFIPDGQSLVLLGSIKTPYCSKGRLDCICPKCAPDSSEDNIMNIVQIKLGYVSVMAKLKTDEHLQCIMVCENKHLCGAGESGRLHVFTMNSLWSMQTGEEFILPAGDCTPIVDMKRVSKFASIVVGHNGFGDFIVWDISKRFIISSFSAPGYSVDQFLAFGLISWPSMFSHGDEISCIDEIMAATKSSYLEHAEDNSFLLRDGEDIAIWLLVSTACHYDAQHDRPSSESPTNPARSWKVALLVKDALILGNSLDPRTAAVGASNGYGIAGTNDNGLVYAWELSTGTKLGILHHFKGGRVSCIATDQSDAGVLAVVADDGQMLLYRRTN